MMKRFILCILALFLISPALFAASTKTPNILLMYFDDIEIITPEGNTLFAEDLELEMKIPVGSTITTGNRGNAELELDPNGTVIKLAANTIFKIEKLSGIGTNKTNGFKLLSGKVRAVANAITGDRYELGGPSSVCGVTGTDFGMDIDEGIQKEEAWVLEGSIDFTKKGKDGKDHKIALGKGQKANAFDDDFKPIQIPPVELIKLEEDNGFKKLKDKADKLNKDKSNEPSAEPTPEPTPEPSTEPTPGPSSEPTEAPSGTTPQPTPGPSAEPTPEPTPAPEDPLMKWLRETMGMEIGSITIGDKTYSKAVLQPTLNFGKFKSVLYLPIIYEKDLFNPGNWYHPKGNDEWSFGSDQEGILPITTDILSDLFLKIKYVQWGDIRDDFFFKIGNLNTFTIGHGLIMNNYANDADFPSIRRIGINTGFDFKTWGFEALVNDLTEAEIFGARVYWRPGGGALALGATTVVDINPAGTLPTDIAVDKPTAEMIGNPFFINLGVDMDFPLIENELLSIIFFTDLAGMMPFFTADATGAEFNNIKQGEGWQTMINDSKLRNIGAASGIFGNILMLNYNLHARYFSGTFKPGFFGANYDRISGDYAVETAAYLNDVLGGSDLSIYDTLNMGIYGQAGYTMEKVFSIDLGYMWPFQFDVDGNLKPATVDELHVKATLDKGVIPGVDLSGSISYDRTNFAPMLVELFDTTIEAKKYGWIDEYTVLKGEIVYGIAPTIDLAGLLTGAVARGADGTITYNPDGTQVMDVTFSLETRVHF